MYRIGIITERLRGGGGGGGVCAKSFLFLSFSALLCHRVDVYILGLIYNEAVAMIFIQIRDEYSNSLLYAGI